MSVANTSHVTGLCIFPQVHCRWTQSWTPSSSGNLWGSHYLFLWYCWIYGHIFQEYSIPSGGPSKWSLYIIWRYYWTAWCLQGEVVDIKCDRIRDSCTHCWLSVSCVIFGGYCEFLSVKWQKQEARNKGHRLVRNCFEIPNGFSLIFALNWLFLRWSPLLDFVN